MTEEIAKKKKKLKVFTLGNRTDIWIRLEQETIVLHYEPFGIKQSF